MPLVAFALLAATFGSGCTLIRGTLELPDKAIQSILGLGQERTTVDPVELQSQLIRFSDHYLDVLIATTSQLQEKDGQRPERRARLQRRIALTEDVLAIATGSNAFANLLDMVILVTLTRMKIEDYWMPERFGASAKPLLLGARSAEKEIWRIAATILQMDQLEEPRNDIRTWNEQHPGARTPRDVGALGFASEIQKMSRHTKTKQASGAPSVFNLLMIDPLSGLDPAARELADTRLFAERGLFLMRHMPTLLRWQTELLAIRTVEMPEVGTLLSSTSQLSASAERLSQVSERLPTVISNERQQILAAFTSERQGLTALAAQAKETAAQAKEALAAGKQMSEAANATLKTFQDILKQIESSPSDPNSEPFRIRDYTAAAAQINTTAQRLAELLQAFNQTIGPGSIDTLASRMDLLTKQAQASSQNMVDYAFHKSLILIALACAIILATALAYQLLKRRLAR